MRVFVSGHRGLVGSAVARAIESENDLTWFGKTRNELNLLNRDDVFGFIKDSKPDCVIMCAAKVGGIKANSDQPVEFLTENLQIQTNLLDACHEAKIKRVIFLGSSCIYPKLANQPIKETELLTGPLESTNEPYAIAKIAGLKLVNAYRKEYGHDWISAMPTNVYGPYDNFDENSSHVLPALIRKFHEAKINKKSSVELWGSGNPLREFIHSDDLASAILHLLKNFNSDIPINVGTGQEVSTRGLANIICEVVEFKGEISWNSDMPDGTPRKVLDSTLINQLGWKPRISLETGISDTYNWFLAQK